MYICHKHIINGILHDSSYVATNTFLLADKLLLDCKCLFYRHCLYIGLDTSLVQATQTGSKGTYNYRVGVNSSDYCVPSQQ